MASKTKTKKEKKKKRKKRRRGNQKTHKHCSRFHNTKHIIKTRGNNSFSRCNDLYFFFFFFFFFFVCGYKPVIPLRIYQSTKQQSISFDVLNTNAQLTP